MYNVTHQSPVQGGKALFCLYLTKRACLFLLIAFISLSTAAQPLQKLNANYTNMTLAEVFAALEKQSSYVVNYSRSEVNTNLRVTVRVSQATVREFMTLVLKNTPYQFSIDGDIIVVKARPREAVAVKPGRITGKIIDEEDGRPVPGATVQIGDKSTISDIDGSFALSLPKGIYTASITSVGYGAKNVTNVEVKEDRVFTLELTMKKEKGQLAGVVVTASARKESVASLYVRQKNNASITDGISAEQIGRTPDKNIGESLKRISGLSALENRYVVVRGLSERYNLAMLNGQQMPSTELNRKQFSFDIIPSNMVDNITVAKTLTPDMSAEFGGGLVQINTKDIPVENFLSVTAGTTINDRTAGKDMLSFQREGNRGYAARYATHRYLYGQKEWQSLEAIRAYKETHKENAVLNNNWQPYYYAAQPSQNYQLSLGRVFRLNTTKQNRLGLIASASYRNTQNIQGIISSRFGFESPASVGYTSTENSFRGNQYAFSTSIGGVLGIGYTSGRSKISWQNIGTVLLDEQLNFGGGKHVVLAEDSRAVIEKVQQTQLWQSQLKGEHTPGKKGIRLNWIGNYTRIKRERPDNHIAIWKTVPDTFKLPHNDFTVTQYYSEGLSSGVLRMFTLAEEKNYSWDGSVQIPFTVSSSKNTFRTGYSGWTKDRQFYVAMIGDQPDMSGTANYPSLPNLFSAAYGGGKNFVSGFGDDYSRMASLHAAYAMLDNRLGELRLVWGVRAEYYNMNSANQALDVLIARIKQDNGTTQIDDFSALYNREKNWKLFPSANLTWSLTPRLNLRAAYARSTIRPDLREMAFFREYDFELGGIYSADFLRSTMLDNYDLRMEWYPGPGEVLSASFFYKDIKYPMEIYKMSGNNIYTLQNNYKSHNYGLEAEIRKSLSFLDAAIIKNLTVYGNFTALTSRVTPMIEATPVEGNRVVIARTIGKEEKRPLMGQSNYIGNAGLYYDDKHLHISLSYNAVSNRLMIYEQNAISSQYERPMRSFDGQIAWRFLQQAEIKLNISNLLNESNIIYINAGKTPEEQAEAQKGNYSNRFLLHDKRYDYLVQRLTPGRTYGISFSYVFK